MKIAIIVATLGRRAETEELVRDLDNQTRPPDRVVFAIVNAEDAPGNATGPRHEIIHCERKGSCAQRNIAIDRVASDADIVVFFDDDFVPASRYLEELERIFRERPGIVGCTGLVVADGATGPELSRAEALAAIKAHETARPDGAPAEKPRKGLYGCNMAVRASALGGRRFDEALPLYGWLEDLDLTARMAADGDLVESARLVGAHRGVKRGRTSGVRFGYSQVANPVYLLRKGGAPAGYLVRNIVRNLAANLLRSVSPEAYIDRRGRLKGNWLGVLDALRGRLSPGRILDL